MPFPIRSNRNHNATPVSPDDQVAFVEGVTFSTLDEVYQAECKALDASFLLHEEYVISGEITAEDILSIEFLKDFHRFSFNEIYKWAGDLRKRDTNIGSDPSQIYVHTVEALGNVKYILEETETSLEEACMLVHWLLVSIHPFTDGNGRITRSYANLLLMSLTEDKRVFDWKLKDEYISALKVADKTMKMTDLLEITPTIPRLYFPDRAQMN